MLACDFQIIYTKGKHNVVADALSRKEEETKGSLCSISISQSNWMEEARIEWKKHQEVCNTIQQLQEEHNSLDDFVRKNDFLWYHGRLYLCNNSQFK